MITFYFTCIYLLEHISPTLSFTTAGKHIGLWWRIRELLDEIIVIGNVKIQNFVRIVSKFQHPHDSDHIKKCETSTRDQHVNQQSWNRAEDTNNSWRIQVTKVNFSIMMTILKNI